MSCHDVLGSNHGSERNARLVYRDNMQNESERPEPKDIYAVFV